MNSSDIRDAVRECLTDCLSVDMPLSAMATYSGRLRDRGWAEQDVHRVELVVVRVLSRLVQWGEVGEELTERSYSGH